MLSGLWSVILLLPAAYLAGSVPFGLLIGKWFRGIDLREHGSRNIGATNAARVLGAKWGALVLLLDALKGLLPTWLLPLLVADPSQQLHVRVGCGVAAILGHMFPPWLGFRGGKGVATSLGVVAIVAPWGTLVAVAMFAVVFALTRIVSASSIAAALALAISQMIYLSPHPFDPANWSVGVFSLLAPLLVIVRHRDNIRRLLRGQEKRLHTAPAEPQISPDTEAKSP
jgi:glycerol-3-phosphate acyltransferase PlsY